ncbi:choice-of-anchor Q domain-containing protein [Wenzhouxiangella marina]|uniref:Uncharacterized protein n=1 Tax=Wenzhouxiangella marina TaxID=1579979 RepID=A0A0K0XRW9_9GAMM|nr:choice-of-anchor Q domain-containing protein [Wenzhouxiangella marina]AKS40438.1 hypothetical protein WM2015_47 [Wenzhouxiangella marina]MBB6088240.1 hypothetical protein [Wenzhouxiangella marina]
MSTRSSFKYAQQRLCQQHRTALASTIGGVLAAGSLQAATITVTTLDDGFIAGQCSLRSAIAAANNNAAIDGCAAGSSATIDRIVFAPGLTGTIALQPGLPVANYWDGSQLRVRESIVIEGPPLNGGVPQVAVQGSGAAPVFYLDPQAAQVTLANLTITGGHSPAELPGRAGHGGGVLSYARILELDGITISGNTADHSGGGVWHDPALPGGVLLGRDCVVNANVAGRATNGLGGGIGVRNSAISINACAFVDNQVGDAGYGGNGGGLAIQQSSLTGVVDSLFVNNTATYGSGGGLHFEGSESQVYLAGNFISNNLADLRGGGIYLDEQTQAGQNPAVLELLDNDFLQNRSYAAGGGLSLIAGPGRIDLSDSRLLENQSINGAGGELQLTGTDLDWFGGSISSNLASGFGGGLYLRSSDNALTFDRLAFFSNQADNGCGGALSILPQLALSGPDSMVVQDSVIFDNSASCGGAFDLFLPTSNPSQLLLSANEWSANRASGLGGTDGNGGAVYFNGGQDGALVISNSTLSGNLAALSGGALFARGQASTSVKYSTLALNQSAGLGRTMISNNASCLLRNSIIASPQSSALEGSTACYLVHSLLQNTSESVYTSGAGVLLDQDPLLGPLVENGAPGWTLTHAPGAGSPVIDAGNASLSTPQHDQRGPGFDRVLGAALDMGALETPATAGDRIFSDRFDSGN